MLYVYEELGITIDQEVVGQYLQHGRIAKDFAAYLDLYAKYKTDYQIDGILKGVWKPSAIEKLKFAAFDERLSVVGLLISRLGEMLDLGVKLDLVQKSGSWFNMGDIRLGQGRDAAKQYFRDHPDEADKLEAAIRRDFHKLMSSQSKIAAKAAGRAVDVSADDFDDED